VWSVELWKCSATVSRVGECVCSNSPGKGEHHSLETVGRSNEEGCVHFELESGFKILLLVFDGDFLECVWKL